MNTVKIRKVELLEKIKANRKTHANEYEEAYAGYKVKVIEGLQRLLENAKAGAELKTSINLPAPQNYTDEYDTIIAMLEMSVDEVIELQSRDFNKYVLDNWEWKQTAKSVFAGYTTSK